MAFERKEFHITFEPFASTERFLAFGTPYAQRPLKPLELEASVSRLKTEISVDWISMIQLLNPFLPAKETQAEELLRGTLQFCVCNLSSTSCFASQS